MTALNDISLGGVIDILVMVEEAPPSSSGRVRDIVYVLRD